MMRPLAAATAAALLLSLLDPLAPSLARAADPVQEIPLDSPKHVSHTLAYGCFILGVGMIAGSFALSQHADDLYGEYLNETDPEIIPQLFDEATRYDRYASAALIGGEVVVATGLYLRFLRRPSAPRFQFAATPQRCAFVWRF